MRLPWDHHLFFIKIQTFLVVLFFIRIFLVIEKFIIVFFLFFQRYVKHIVGMLKDLVVILQSSAASKDFYLTFI